MHEIWMKIYRMPKISYYKWAWRVLHRVFLHRVSYYSQMISVDMVQAVSTPITRKFIAL